MGSSVRDRSKSNPPARALFEEVQKHAAPSPKRRQLRDGRGPGEGGRLIEEPLSRSLWGGPRAGGPESRGTSPGRGTWPDRCSRTRIALGFHPELANLSLQPLQLPPLLRRQPVAGDPFIQVGPRLGRSPTGAQLMDRVLHQTAG